jgi:N-acetylmuramoyl-L-alanine amidase
MKRRFFKAARAVGAALAWLLLLALSGLCLRRPCQAATIILDPGHGGADSGATPRGMIAEKRAALDVASRAASKLRAAGHRVLLTRRSDEFIELADRVNLSNRTSGKPLFISLHFNSASNRSISGLETYYYTRRSAKLANALHQSLLKSTRSPNRGIRTARFYVLRFNKQPAVLLELGFLSHAREGSNISRSPAYRQKLADAIAAGISSLQR